VRFDPTSVGLLPGCAFTRAQPIPHAYWQPVEQHRRIARHCEFSGESSTGWQQVNFGSPVAVTAGYDVCRKLLFADWSLFARPELLHHQWS